LKSRRGWPRDAGAELLAVINASPFHVGKGSTSAKQMMRERVRDCGLPLVYAHLVGGQDEVVFEGHSFAVECRRCSCRRVRRVFVENLFEVQVDRVGRSYAAC
jgi:NAD+ synthase (glutamine-hydrolysing)